MMFGKGATEKFAAAVAKKTGLQMQGDRFAGEFRGFQAWAHTEMAANVGALVQGSGGGLLGGLGALFGGGTGGMVHAMTGGDFFMKHDYVIELPDAALPGASLRETTSFLVHKSLQQRPAIGAKTTSGVKWIDKRYEVCSNDPAFIQRACTSPELQKALKGWPYLNLSWEPQRVWLELLDTPVRISSKFSGSAQSNGDMVLQGLEIVAAAARAAIGQ
jgi:hypothetical protein